MPLTKNDGNTISVAVQLFAVCSNLWRRLMRALCKRVLKMRARRHAKTANVQKVSQKHADVSLQPTVKVAL